LYEDEHENKSVQSEDYDARSRFTSVHDESNSHFGSESYAPSRNMFQNTDKRGLMEKEALPAEIQDGETTEVLKGSSARRHGLLLVGYSLGGSRLRA
jgi:chitin synthase